ncbi:DUF6103 family protein [Dehalobacter sp. DCM]|jgi:hypothetical protein|uniref:DUF6103 family protein n=1 Tax=Dehalobacter sp. DCM TaxID=2907827 RepID=UPI003081852C|nr:DUF6103 family protein [Dehalobacter sp. DCM]
MKKATIQVSYDAEKLGAIRQYMAKKDTEFQSELEDFMQKLYEKHVPAPVRDYIENREPDELEVPRRPSRPVVPARPQNHDGGSGE